MREAIEWQPIETLRVSALGLVLVVMRPGEKGPGGVLAASVWPGATGEDLRIVPAGEDVFECWLRRDECVAWASWPKGPTP